MYKIYPVVKTYEMRKDDAYLVKNSIKVYNSTAYLTGKIAKLQKAEDIDTEEDADLKYIKSAELPAEGYNLSIDSQGIIIRYVDYNGMLYATGTLCQILSQMKDGKLEALEIYDSPMMAVRGFFLDISRNKVPTLESVKQVLDLMELLKMNHFQLYVEGFTVELDSFKQYLTEDSYITKEEYVEIESYANVRGIDFVPCHNGFGHMAPYLRLPEFHDLCELPEGTDKYTIHLDCRTLNPLDPGSIELVKRIYKDFLPMSKSNFFNMCFDEPFELGKGKSAEMVKKEGVGKVYADFLLKAYEEIKKYDKVPFIFGDIVYNHSEVYDILPKDAYYLVWGNEISFNFDFFMKKLSKIGGKLIATPGTNNWNSFLGRIREAIINIDAAIDAALNNSAEGVILNDWGDGGHLQFLPASLMLIAYTGLKAWRKYEDDYDNLLGMGGMSTSGNYFDMIYFSNEYIWKDKDHLFAQTILDLCDYSRYLPYFLTNSTTIFHTYGQANIEASREEQRNKTDSEMISAFLENAKPYFMSEKAYKFLDEFLNLKVKEIDMASLGCEDGDLVKAEFKQSITEIKAVMKVDVSFNKNTDGKARICYLSEALEIAQQMAENHKALWYKRAKISGYKNIEKDFNSFVRFIEAALRHFQGEITEHTHARRT